jgi:hypothetical protein
MRKLDDRLDIHEVALSELVERVTGKSAATKLMKDDASGDDGNTADSDDDDDRKGEKRKEKDAEAKAAMIEQRAAEGELVVSETLKSVFERLSGANTPRTAPPSFFTLAKSESLQDQLDAMAARGASLAELCEYEMTAQRQQAANRGLISKAAVDQLAIRQQGLAVRDGVTPAHLQSLSPGWRH